MTEPVELMQRYNNHQSIYPDFANPLWFPAWQFSPGLFAAGVAHVVKPRANSFGQNMPTFIVGGHETNSWCNVGNNLNLATGGQRVAVKRFSDQNWPLPHHRTNNPVFARVDLMTVAQTAA